MPRTTRTLTVVIAACAIVLALAPSAHADRNDKRDVERDLRIKIDSYTRSLKAKQADLEKVAAESAQAESDARAFIEKEKQADAKLADANAQAVAARQAAADANRAAAEQEKRLRDRIDQDPEIVAAAEHFEKVDRARQRITESVLTPLRATDEYKAKLSELAELEKQREDYLAASGGSPDPQRVQLYMAQQQTVEAEIKQMEITALGLSEQAVAARAAAEQASARLNSLRDDRMRELRTGPEAAQLTDTLADARRLIGEKTKAVADAKRVVAAAEADTRKAKAKYSFYAQQVDKLQREVEGLEYAIGELRRQLGNR